MLQFDGSVATPRGGTTGDLAVEGHVPLYSVPSSRPLFVMGSDSGEAEDEESTGRVRFGPLDVAISQDLSPRVGAGRRGSRRGRNHGRAKGGSRHDSNLMDEREPRVRDSRLRPDPRPVKKHSA